MLSLEACNCGLAFPTISLFACDLVSVHPHSRILSNHSIVTNKTINITDSSTTDFTQVFKSSNTRHLILIININITTDSDSLQLSSYEASIITELVTSTANLRDRLNLHLTVIMVEYITNMTGLKVKAPVSEKHQKKAEKSEVDKLRAGLETLPQELYDMIYNAVFTAAPGFRNLSKHHKKTYRRDFNLLHVSHHSRALFASSYYGNQSRFHFVHWMHYSHDTVRPHSWLAMLPGAHRALVFEVCLTRRQRTSESLTPKFHQIVARDLWQARYHWSQGDDAIKRNVFMQELGNGADARKRKTLA